ncbi:hypothetical protein [Neobacillus kokaensis]|uniref:Uncharacterized protein n=1 Tax=Neobacillus kokaensis TaxID=2759023 RepID=A0ABQ3MWQ6_9BACI|nr:hypothetical protein [Neobacillus kokaensis]GHH96857.1 hypothetical protein AM1BK_04000 [Neobacillus kokaensis]
MTKTGGICINQLKLNYTHDMEKAMYSAHGVCFADYSRKLDVRMKVERRREREYLQSQHILTNIEKKLHY